MGNYTNIQKLIIPGELNDLNQYTNACRSSWFQGAKMKRENGEVVRLEAISQKLKKINSPCFIEHHFYCKNKRKDKDNIAGFGVKAIHDGLQEASILSQDSWAAIDGYRPFFYIDKNNPRIEVIISW